MTHVTALLTLCGLALAAAAANATVTIDAVESGGDVVFDLSGSLDLTGATPAGLGSRAIAGVGPSIGAIFWAGSNRLFLLSSGPANFGPGDLTVTPAVTGDVFFVSTNDGLVGVPLSYTSTSPLASTMTFVGQDFASLGIDVGSYTWTIPNDTVVLNVIVPEPSSALLLAAGLVGLARRRCAR